MGAVNMPAPTWPECKIKLPCEKNHIKPLPRTNEEFVGGMTGI